MNATTPLPSPVNATTPSDGEAPTQAPAKKRKSPRKFRLFDDGGGDFRLYEVAAPGHKTLPAGALVPIPEFGGYGSAIEAMKALRANGDKLQGKTVLLFRGVNIVRIVVETKPRIALESKPRKEIGGAAE